MISIMTFKFQIRVETKHAFRTPLVNPKPFQNRTYFLFPNLPLDTLVVVAHGSVDSVNGHSTPASSIATDVVSVSHIQLPLFVGW